MRNIGLCLLSFAFVLTMAPFIGAGDVKTGAEGWSAEGIEITGSIEMPMVYLDKGITSILDAVEKTDSGKHQKSVFVWCPLVTLNLKADVADAVTGFVQLENRQLGSSLRWAFVDLTEDGVVNPVWQWTGGGTGDYLDFGGGDNIDMAVEQAYIKVSKFNGIDMTIGIQDLKVTLREGEGAFFIDVSESENAAIPTMQEFFIGGLPFYKDNTEFSGLRFDYGTLEDSNYHFCLFWGTVEETGAVHNDENLLGAVLDYKLPGEKNLLQVSLTQISKHLDNMNIQTIGIGIDYFEAVPNLEIYSELYLQSGDYGRTLQAGVWKTIDQDARAFRLGGKYTLVETTGKPWVDISYWSLSGDEDEATVKGQRENNNFVSYEHSQSTLILEGNLTGLDLDSNYTALKVELGITAEVDVNKDGTDETLDLSVLFGSFELEDDLKIQQLKDDLGTEIDLVATLHYNKSVDFELAWASVRDADFFTKNINAGLPVQDDDDMTLVYFGTKIKF